MREREYVFERPPRYGEAKEPNRKDYANYKITCKVTEDIYYGVISGI